MMDNVSLNPLSSIRRNKSGENILINQLLFEFEMRRSHVTDFLAKEELNTCIVEIELDPANIYLLQEANELTQETLLRFEVVSKDKRCLKTRTKEKELTYWLKKKVP